MKPATVALAVGIAIGLIIPVLVYTVGSTHVECTRGELLGWSRWLAMPEATGLAPPGGFVTFTWEELSVWSNPFSLEGLGGGPTGLLNSTVAYYRVANWTMFAVDSDAVPGAGPSVTCPSYELGLGANGNQTLPFGGCAGCPVSPPTPAGVGSRLVIPSQVTYGNLSSSLLDASYGPTPNGSFAWSLVGGNLSVTGPSGLAGLNVVFEPYFNDSKIVGLAITIRQTLEQLEIPIRLLTGGTVDVPASYPTDWDLDSPATQHYWDNNTYLLPASDDQGSWNVYVPGAGSEFGLAGLLFVQTAE